MKIWVATVTVTYTPQLKLSFNLWKRGRVMSITIDGITKEETAYDKYVQFTYEGESYSALLHWDKYNGYEVTFTEIGKTYLTIDDPEWAINWEGDNEESLAFVLDDLTENVLEASYL
jgi:hypothetical protein